MSYRTILTLASGQPDDRDALAVACDLGRRFGAQVRVLPSAPDPAQMAMGYDLWGGGVLAAEFSAAVEEAQAQIMTAVATAAREAADQAEIPYGVEEAGACVAVAEAAASPWQTLLNEAPFGDLFVVARATAMGTGALSSVFADVLMDLRLPILIANGARPVCGGTAVVAWNGSMEAGRAVRAAIPLLLAADQVLVAQQEASVQWDEADAAVLRRCTGYLERHGVRHLEALQIEGKTDRGALLQAVKDAGADLLVAGAYGHPRWQEFLFGGFTRALFQDEDAPHVLVSH